MTARATLVSRRYACFGLHAHFAGAHPEGLPEGPVECRQAVESPAQSNIRDRPVADRAHERGPAFLESTAQHILREARPGRLEQKVQLTHRYLQR